MSAKTVSFAALTDGAEQRRGALERGHHRDHSVPDRRERPQRGGAGHLRDQYNNRGRTTATVLAMLSACQSPIAPGTASIRNDRGVGMAMHFLPAM